MSVNKVILLGYVSKFQDVVVRTTQQGKKTASFTLVTTESWKDKTKYENHRVVVFAEGLVGIVEKYAEKGSKIYIEGSLQTRKWQAKDGSDRYTTEIVLQGYHGKIEILTDRKQSEYETSVKNTESQNEDMDIPRNVHFMG